MPRVKSERTLDNSNGKTQSKLYSLIFVCADFKVQSENRTRDPTNHSKKKKQKNPSFRPIQVGIRRVHTYGIRRECFPCRELKQAWGTEVII